MKILEPWGHQRLSSLLEKTASREAETWRIYVPKKPSSQVRISPCCSSLLLLQAAPPGCSILTRDCLSSAGELEPSSPE